MTSLPQTRRPAVTLTEVLVAMFVMALGLISLLTLFPLGAIQIGVALRDDRCAQTATQADAFLRSWWQAKIVEGVAPLTETAFVAMDDPNNNAGSTTSTLLPAVPATDTAASYPVFVDPLTHFSKTGTDDQTWVAHASWAAARGSTPVNQFQLPPRRKLDQVVTNPPEAVRLCTLADDLTFGPNGTAQAEPSSPTLLSRQGRYNWSAILQRPDNSQQKIANLTVLVFDGRPPLINQSGDEVVNKMTGVAVGNNSVTVTLPNPTDPTAPSVIRKGGWVMDGTISDVTIKVTPAGTPVEGTDFVKVRQANWHRIVGVISSPSGTQTAYTLDLDPPIRPLKSKFGVFTTYTDSPATFINYTASLYFFTGLAEVFSRPKLTPPIGS